MSKFVLPFTFACGSLVAVGCSDASVDLNNTERGEGSTTVEGSASATGGRATGFPSGNGSGGSVTGSGGRTLGSAGNAMGQPSASGGAVTTSAGGRTNGGSVIGTGGRASGAGGSSNSGRPQDATGGASQVSTGRGGAGTAGGTPAAGGRLNRGGAPGSGGAPPSGGAPVGSVGGRIGGAGGANSPVSGAGGSAAGGSRASGVGGATAGGSGAGGSRTGSTSDASLCPGATQTLTVGSGQQYATVQAAVNAVPSGNSKLIEIKVKAGTYKEQVTINKPFVCLVGEGATTTVITNALGTNIVTGGTVLVSGSDFSAANIAFQNTGGDGSGQAVALMANGMRQQFRDCRFLSYQDTLYVNTGRQYFKDCYIQGDTDYIFGDATAVFENCTMNNVAEGTAVTAPRTPQNTPYGLVFLGGSLTANPTTSSVRSNHVYLGRPWGPYGAAAFLNVAMGAHIATDGWTTMSSNTLANTRFSEYKSTGAGANATNGTRSSRQLTDAQAANYTVEKVLSPWVPSYSQ